jgi:hypothetical protein
MDTYYIGTAAIGKWTVGMRDTGYGIRDTGYGIRDTGYGIRIGGFGYYAYTQEIKSSGDDLRFFF